MARLSWRKPKWPKGPSPEKLAKKLRLGVLDLIAPDSTAESKDLFRVGEQHTRSLVVYDKPALATPGWQGWLTSLLLLDGGPDAKGSVRLSLTWRPYSPFSASVKLTMAETSHGSTVALGRMRGWNRQRKEANALADVERVQQALSENATRLLAVSVVVTCSAPTQDGLDATWQQVTNALTARMLHWRPLDDRHALGFRMQTAGHARDIWHPLTWDTGTLAASWPAVGTTVDMGTGPVWGTDAADGRLVRYDPFNTRLGGPPAPHVCIIGPTGNGKSVAFFTAVSEYLTLANPPRIRIIDPKRDYKLVCEMLSGTRIVMSEDAPVAINMFDLSRVEWKQTDDGPTPAKNVVYEGIRNVLGTVRLMCEATGAGFSPAFVSVVQTAAERAYWAKGIETDEPDSWDVTREDVPTLADLYATLQDMSKEPEHGEPARDLAVLLRPYAVGIWKGLFARPTNADLNNPVIVYDVADLDKSLRPVVMHLIAALTWREARRSPHYTIFGMDEVTQLLRFPESGRLVADMYLLGRSAGLSAWSMAQRVGHYTKTQEGEDTLGMAHTVLLLRQEDDVALADAAARFKLTPRQTEFLSGAGIGQGVLYTATRGNATLNIEPCPVVLEWLPKRVTAETSQNEDGAPSEAPSSQGGAGGSIPDRH